MDTIHVKPNPIVCDPVAAFQSKIGQELFELFKEGGTLKVWRHTSPAAWWIEHTDGREFHWNPDHKMRPTGTPEVGLLVRLGQQVSAEGEVTSAAGTKPGKEAWAFDSNRLEQAQATWSYAQECVKDWEDHAGTFSGSLDNLSPRAQAAVLTLRSKSRIPMCPELLSVLLELNAAGLITVHPEGYATLRVPAKDLKMPKVKPLKIVRIEPAAAVASAS